MRLGSRRSRRRSNVRVTGGGCCLPLALTMVSAPGLVLRLIWRAAR